MHFLTDRRSQGQTLLELQASQHSWSSSLLLSREVRNHWHPSQSPRATGWAHILVPLRFRGGPSSKSYQSFKGCSYPTSPPGSLLGMDFSSPCNSQPFLRAFLQWILGYSVQFPSVRWKHSFPQLLTVVSLTGNCLWSWGIVTQGYIPEGSLQPVTG